MYGGRMHGRRNPYLYQMMYRPGMGQMGFMGYNEGVHPGITGQGAPPPGQGAPGGSMPPPITQQPQHGPAAGRSFLAPPERPPGCPPGLEYLTVVDRILMEQLVEPFEVLTGIETCNQYRLMNAQGLQVYYAVENSDLFTRQCLGSRREFIMSIVDNMGQEVMRVVRPYVFCGGCCCACCSPCQMKISVEAPVGIPIAYATQVPGCLKSNFVVTDSQGNPHCYVKGPPCCVCCPFIEQRFPVLQGGEPVGEITKHFSGMLKEMYTDADNFSVSFPLNMPVQIKAGLLGLLFLIDFMAFENNHISSSGRPRLM